MKRPLLSALTCIPAAALAVATVSGQYTMTVNKDRLINAQINRDNVKNLRLVWAMALGGMQDVGQNGPESEIHPLVDNGFLYTSDGWGTLYKIDGRNPNEGEFVWVTDP